jgi:CheY-like chemotaxis protein
MFPQPGLVQVFLAEDHAPDVTLIKESLGAARIQFELERVADGERALERLLRYENADRPDVIILDLNLPRIGGFSVLTRLRENAALLNVPVLILTSSREPSDREEAMRLGAAAFVSKPPDLEDFTSAVAATIRRLLGLEGGEPLDEGGGLAHAHTHGHGSNMHLYRRQPRRANSNAPTQRAALNSAVPRSGAGIVK